MSLKETLETLIARRDLTPEEAEAALETIIRGGEGYDPCQASAMLCLLRSKGETAEEIAGMVRAMQRHMIPVPLEVPSLDIVGTGGDGHHTVNVSTAASVVVASCGAAVAKHGNRSVSSKCGSADVLEACGIRLTVPPSVVQRCVNETGIAFMFAPAFHPAMKAIVPVRAALGVRTVFNILGPLLNPSKCARMLIGVYSEPLVPLMAEALHQLGAEFALVVHCQGLDELAPVGIAKIATVRPSGVELSELDPQELGFAKCTIDDLKGGDCEENAETLRQILAGKLPGHATETVVLNAGAALYVAGKAESIKEGCGLARDALREGRPLKVLQQWALCSQSPE